MRALRFLVSIALVLSLACGAPALAAAVLVGTDRDPAIVDRMDPAGPQPVTIAQTELATGQWLDAISVTHQLRTGEVVSVPVSVGAGSAFQVTPSTTNPGQWDVVFDAAAITDWALESDQFECDGEEKFTITFTYNDGRTLTDDALNLYFDEWQGIWQGALMDDFIKITRAAWFPHNTVCAYGPTMQMLVPGVTDAENLTAAVVDLTVQGTQTFKLVGANCWHLGTVFVKVDGDTLTVSYLMDEDVNTRDVWDEIKVEQEWFTLFTHKSDITSAERDQLGDGYAFNQPISISQDLGGATAAVLYINSVMTYSSHSPFVYPFWCNSRYETPARDAMLQLYTTSVLD